MEFVLFFFVFLESIIWWFDWGTEDWISYVDNTYQQKDNVFHTKYLYKNSSNDTKKIQNAFESHGQADLFEKE